GSDGAVGAGRPGGVPDAAAPGPARSSDVKGEPPPSNTGGVTSEERCKLVKGDFIGRRIDYFTVTVPRHVGRMLCEETVVEQVGGGREGFRQSEYRACPGGGVWRRWDPVQASGQHGTE